jgi:predicted aspartyl protease
MYHLRYRSASTEGDVAVSDSYETRGNNTLDYRLVSTTHGIRSERGEIAGWSWLQTANGLVLPDTRLPTVFDRTLAAATRRPDPRVRMLGVTRAAPHQYVLQIAPNARIRQLRYFDVDSFLLREAVSEDYDGAVTTQRYSGYVRICGNPLSTHVTRSNSLSPETYDITMLKHEQIPPDRRLVAVPRSRTPFVVGYPLHRTLNSLVGESGVLIRVDIRGAPYWLKLDSGSSTIALDRDLVRRLGGREFGKGVTTKGGRVEFSSAVIPRLDIGPVYATNVVVGVLNEDELQQGVEVVGLLGCDFIASRPLAIDFQSQTVTLIDAPPAATDRSWTVVRTPLRSCTPMIRVRIEDEPVTLALDLGATKTILNEDACERIADKLHELDATRIRFIGGVTLDAMQYVAPHATAGDLRLGPLVVTVVSGGRGQNLDDDGILGTNVLGNYRIILDYAHGRTFFRRYAVAH